MTARCLPWMLVAAFFVPALGMGQVSRAGEHAPDQPADHAAKATEGPVLPEGMTLDEVLDWADSPPVAWPKPIPDQLHFLSLVEQLEHRNREEGTDQLGWEAQGWLGYDFDKIWWKSEGEAAVDGTDEGEVEFDLLYSKLVTPFWNAQVGLQYATEWANHDTDDRWSGVVALQGLAPGMVELDASVYLSDDGDLTAQLEAEYNIYLTQKLVIQPRLELGLSAQSIRERTLGAGVTDVGIDLRVRYEVRREFAPYVGIRYGFLADETERRARRAGGETNELLFLLGVRLAF